MRRRISTWLALLGLAIAIMSCGGSQGEKGDKGDAGTTGAAGTNGANGTNGVGITSNKKINADADSTDHCDTDPLTCRFLGGQRVLLGDGTAIITGEWKYLNDTLGDTDTTSVSMIVPSTTTTAYRALSDNVKYPNSPAGTNPLGNVERMFLVYTVASDTLQLVWDKNQDKAAGSGDYTVSTLTLSNW